MVSARCVSLCNALAVDRKCPVHGKATTADECPGCGERCDICDDRMCREYGPAPATTCAAHRHCEDCDRDNPCRDCAALRREDEADWLLRVSKGARTW